MPKLLIEYKNQYPAIVNYRNPTIVKTTFIVIHKTDKFVYQRSDFETIDDAIDFKIEGSFKLIFIRLESEKDEEYFYIEFKNSILSAYDSKIDRASTYNSYNIIFTPIFIDVSKKNIPGGLQYSNRFTRIISNELWDNFFELIPRFEDLLLETAFVYDVITTNSWVERWSDMEAYLLQAKNRVEKEIEKKNINISA